MFPGPTPAANPVKNLVRFTETDIQTMGQALGLTEPGLYLKLKSRTNEYRYIPQVKDTADPTSLAVKPSTREIIYRQNTYVAHGRVTGQTTVTNQGPGVGPCMNGNFNRGNCVANGSSLVPTGWSHLGVADRNIEGHTLQPNEQNANGLACYTCHASWQNTCNGCHLTLADNDGNTPRYAGSPISGVLSLGFIQQGDFTWIGSQEWSMGINSRGKIAPTMPETKAFQRHITKDNQNYNVTILGANTNAAQAATGYKTYRDRLGYGNVTNAFAATQGVQVGIKTVDPYGNTDPSNITNFNHDPRSDVNGGLGAQAFMPHTVQNRTQVRNCQGCHFDLNGANNANQVAYATAQVGVNPNGYQAAQSGYIQFFQNEVTIRNNTNQPVLLNQGYLFDPVTDPQGTDGLAHRLDYLVLADGFPLAYQNHPYLFPLGAAVDPKYHRVYDPTAPGPFTEELLRGWNVNDAISVILVAPLNTQQ
jgi:hypothetical protein